MSTPGLINSLTSTALIVKMDSSQEYFDY